MFSEAVLIYAALWITWWIEILYLSLPTIASEFLGFAQKIGIHLCR
jgi:hypothetical protein